MQVHRVSEDFDEAFLRNGDLDTPFSKVMAFFASVYDFDILMNAARAYTDNDLDKACLYEHDDLLIVVPRGKKIPHYLLIFQIVQYDVWCASLGSLLAVSLTTILIRKCASQRLDATNIFLDNYRILLTESPPDRPRRQQERLLFVLWVLHCIVFATLFQTIFMSALVVPRYYPDIDTFEDLHKAQMKVYTGEYIRIQIVKGMQGENKHFLDLLKSVPKEISTFSESMDWIVNYRQDNGFIISQERMYELKVLDKEAAQGAYH
ncbi:Ionotropic receptor 10a, partial [Carabus blaptoides fortunei]